MSKWVHVTATVIKEFLVEIKDDQINDVAEEVVSNELMEFEELECQSVLSNSVESYKRSIDKDKILSL